MTIRHSATTASTATVTATVYEASDKSAGNEVMVAHNIFMDMCDGIWFF